MTSLARAVGLLAQQASPWIVAVTVEDLFGQNQLALPRFAKPVELTGAFDPNFFTAASKLVEVDDFWEFKLFAVSRVGSLPLDFFAYFIRHGRTISEKMVRFAGRQACSRVQKL